MKTIFSNNAPLPDNDEKVHPMYLVYQLGRVRRFNGSVNPEWTVLHHSMLCAILWTKAYGPEGMHHALFHDAHEYVTGDIASPVKNAIGREHVEKVERVLDERVYDMLEEDLPDFDKQYVKYVDWAALFIEAYYIGVEGHVKHIVDTSTSHLDKQTRQNITEVIALSCPEVVVALQMCGFYGTPAAPTAPTEPMTVDLNKFLKP